MTAQRSTILMTAACVAWATWAVAQQQPAPAPAQPAAQAPITKVNMLKMNATITGIDSTKRIVTLRDDMGNEDEFAVSPDMQRFNELMVGQKVAITYYESLVLNVLKPGQQGLGNSSEAALNRAKGALPAGTLATQDKRTVTVKAIDPSVPSVTVTTEDGRTVTR